MIPMYNWRTTSFIYIPQHHNYSTSTWDVRDICEPECSVGDYIALTCFWLIGLIMIGGIIFMLWDMARDF